MQVGDVVVAKSCVPRRFLNIKPGTFWKVVGIRGGNDRITVGDGAKESIKTHSRYFHVLDDYTQDTMLALEGTDMAYRMDAIQSFRPELKNQRTPNGHVKVTVNGSPVYVSKEVAGALASRNPDKLVQKKLAMQLGGI